MKRWLVTALICLAGVMSACAERAPSPKPWRPPPQQQPPRAPIPLKASAQVTVEGHAAVIDVELAQTELERSQGLMYRQRLGRHKGMLFLMPREQDWAFYMRNTLIPLDIIFIDRSWKVVGVVAKAAPLTETLRRVGVPSLYVLELDAGEAARLGIQAGTALSVKRGGERL